ncbi:PREDICTED: 14 kDa proline-rich protein DC2.15-like [Lupinus angustifolius]|uniref:14 kDa proline-rich protein DC2.15-like n=1 Tax=Lupinus angustifolius TaxID=3871 RepID=UPI00092F921F|nr:PREDICTED: 14 kDa proline-rich protein DC2.15-like [Lupinus angustifolius]
MASKAALLISVNILFFTLVSSNYAPNPSPSTPANQIQSDNCTVDIFKLGVCAVSSWIHVPPWNPCCSLTEGLQDSEAARCLGTAAKTKMEIEIVVLLQLLEKSV